MLTFDIKIYDLTDAFPQWVGSITLISSDVRLVDAFDNYRVIANLHAVGSVFVQFISVKQPTKLVDLWICLQTNK